MAEASKPHTDEPKGKEKVAPFFSIESARSRGNTTAFVDMLEDNELKSADGLSINEKVARGVQGLIQAGFYLTSMTREANMYQERIKNDTELYEKTRSLVERNIELVERVANMEAQAKADQQKLQTAETKITEAELKVTTAETRATEAEKKVNELSRALSAEQSAKSEILKSLGNLEKAKEAEQKTAAEKIDELSSELKKQSEVRAELEQENKNMKSRLKALASSILAVRLKVVLDFMKTVYFQVIQYTSFCRGYDELKKSLQKELQTMDWDKYDPDAVDGEDDAPLTLNEVDDSTVAEFVKFLNAPIPMAEEYPDLSSHIPARFLPSASSTTEAAPASIPSPDPTAKDQTSAAEAEAP